MRKIFFIVLAIVAVACTSWVGPESSEAFYSNVIKKEYPVNSFSKLEIGGPFNVFIRQGDVEQVVVEADEKVISKIKIRNNGEKLTVDTEPFSFNIKKLNVYITLVNVNYIKMYGAGNVESKGQLKFNKLTIDYSRTGNMALDIDCTEMLLDASSTGNIELKGRCGIAEIKRSGVGNFNSTPLIVDVLKINFTGVGNASVFANKEIYINASGVGNLSYSGNAEVKEYKATGVGNVNRE